MFCIHFSLDFSSLVVKMVSFRTLKPSLEDHLGCPSRRTGQAVPWQPIGHLSLDYIQYQGTNNKKACSFTNNKKPTVERCTPPKPWTLISNAFFSLKSMYFSKFLSQALPSGNSNYYKAVCLLKPAPIVTIIFSLIAWFQIFVCLILDGKSPLVFGIIRCV